MAFLKRTRTGSNSQQSQDPSLWMIHEGNRTMMEEHEMQFSSLDGPKAVDMLKQISSLGWEIFVQKPRDYFREVVLEFYANFNESEQTSKIRGKTIFCSPAVLNGLFNLKDIDDTDTQMKIKGKDSDFVQEALEIICPNGIRCISGTCENPSTITCSCMLETSRTWGKFTSSRLVPYMNYSSYNLQRVLLLYAIKKGLPINVGRMIYDGMITCRSKSCQMLYFPSTVTRLAGAFDVPVADLQIVKSKAFIGKAFLNGLRPPRGPDQEASPEEALTESNVGDGLQQLLQGQAQLIKNWKSFKSDQLVKDAILGANMTQLMKELAETRNNQNAILQALENQSAATSMMGNFMTSLVNAFKHVDIPTFSHYSVINPGSSNLYHAGNNMYPILGYTQSISLPSATVFNSTGQGASIFDPTQFCSAPFMTFSDLATATVGSPHNFFSQEPSVPPVHMEEGDFNAQLHFFQGEGTGENN